MEEEISIDSNSEIPTTHFFVYKEKPYPFNFDLFKFFSQYFISNPPQQGSIELFDENKNISESSIPDFIDFCQARKITLTRENAPTLYKLSEKYQVTSLLSKAKEFILTHQKEVVVEIMIMYQNDNCFNMEEFEEIISNELTKYVNDDRLLTLPIQTLYRVVSKYLLKSNSNNSEQPPEFIEFLFKCLDHFGREASVLFDKIDTFGSSGDLINRLLDGYSEKFDFGFVNKNTLKTVYQLENEIITREKEIKEQISASQQEVLSISKHVSDQIELMRKQRQDEVNDRKEVFTQIPKMVASVIEEMRKKHEQEVRERKELFEQEIERMRKQHEEEMKKKDEMIASMLKQFEASQAGCMEEMRKLRGDFDGKMKEMGDQLGVLMSPKITRYYQGDPVGLISILGDDVTISTEKKDCEKYLPDLRKYDNNYFFNRDGRTPSSETDTIIKFDFGSNRKVDLRSYLIKTGSDGPNKRHPKTWRIEGSNDGQSWTELDRRSNDGNLNDQYREHHYVCNLGNPGSKSNLFRYIRYVNEDSWGSSFKYDIEVSYFELYGNVVTV